MSSADLPTLDEVMDKLDKLANLRLGDPIPDWLGINNWGEAISQLARDAHAWLEDLTKKRQ